MKSEHVLKSVKIISGDELDRTYRRLAHQFVEPHDDLENLAIVGMQTRGVPIASRIRKYINEYYQKELPFGVLDVTFYRDDFRSAMKMPTVKVTEIPFDIYGKDLILVDDVLYTGRTVRSAMDALTSYGRPKSIRFCCMVDRGHRELPVTADYVGVNIPTHINEEVRVHVAELDGDDAVYLIEMTKPGEPE